MSETYKVSTVRDILESILKVGDTLTDVEEDVFLNSRVIMAHNTLKFVNTEFTGLFAKVKDGEVMELGCVKTNPHKWSENKYSQYTPKEKTEYKDTGQITIVKRRRHGRS